MAWRLVGTNDAERTSWTVRVRRHRWAPHLGAVAIFMVVATVFLWPAVTRQQVFTTAANTQSVRFPWAAEGLPFTQVVQSDEANLSHPWQSLLSRTLRDEGELAYWNPHSFGGGAPLFANGSSGQLSPPRLVTAFTMSPTSAHEVSSWLHLVGAGCAAYFLLRQLRARWWGGLAAGLAWQCSGFVLAWIHLEVVTPTFVYLPLCVALAHNAVVRRSGHATLGLGVASALLLISGHLLFALLSLLVAFGYGAALAVQRRSVPTRPALHALDRLSRIARLAVAGVAALGLAAIVLVPTAQELADSPRAPVTMDDLRAIGTAQPGEVLLRVGWPDDLPVDADEIQFQPFIGLAGAALALIGFLCRGRAGAALARTLVIVGLAAAVDGPVMWVLHHLPLFNTFRPYGRFSLWATLGLVILVGHGTDATLHWLRRASARRLSRDPRVAYGLLAAVLVLNTGHQLSWGRGANQTFHPRVPESVFPSRPVLDAARGSVTAAGWPVMIVPIDRREPGDAYVPETLGSELHTIFQIDAVSGYDSTVPVRTSQLLRVVQGEATDDVLASPERRGAEQPAFTSRSTRWDLLDRMGVGAVLLPSLLLPDDDNWGGDPARLEVMASTAYSGAEGSLVLLDGWGSGPQLVPGSVVVDDDADALRTFVEPDFEYHQQVVLSASAASSIEALPSGLSPGSGAGSVLAVSRSTNASEITVEVDDPMWLVMPVNWHSGWSARVNGEPVAVTRVNFQRLAVLLPPGRHDVEMTFRPPGLPLGTAVSLTMAMFVSMGYIVLWRRRPRSVEGPRLPAEAERTASARAKFKDELIREQGWPRPHEEVVEPTGDAPGSPAAPTETDRVER